MPSDVRIIVDGITLAVRTWASGEGRSSLRPVVLLPATGETAEDWDVVAARLARTRTVHALSLRGHGDSDWPGAYSIDAFADDVAGFLAQLDGPVDLVGHSLGGLVAARVCAAHPALVSHLVLEDVGLPHRREPAPPRRPAGPLAFDWRVVEQVRPQVDDPDPHWPATLAAISTPTLVIAGGPDSPVPQQHVDELLALVADGRRVTVDAGHLVHDHEPEAFLAHLEHFLER